MFAQIAFPPRGPSRDSLGIAPTEEASSLSRTDCESPPEGQAATTAMRRFAERYCDSNGSIKPPALWSLLIDGRDAEGFYLALSGLNEYQRPDAPPDSGTWLHELARHGRDHPSPVNDEPSLHDPITLADRWEHFAGTIPAEHRDELLLIAARAGNKLSAQCLIKQGADAQLALVNAAQVQDEGAMKLLVELGADAQTAHQHTIESGPIEAARALYRLSGRRLPSPLLDICLQNQDASTSAGKLWSVIINGRDRTAFQVICSLIGPGLLPPPNRNKGDWLFKLARYGTEPATLLQQTIGLAERFKLLNTFMLGADYNALLHCAIRHQNMDAARALIDCGANPTAALYQIAQIPDHVGMARLIELQASPRAAFHMAKQAGHSTAMQALLMISRDKGGMDRLTAHYFDTNAALCERSVHRRAELIDAARRGDLDAIRQQHPDGRELSAALFTASRTQPAIKQRFFDLPEAALSACRRNMNRAAQTTLLRAGANPSDALRLAIQSRDIPATQRLLELGASQEDSLTSAAVNQDLTTAATLAWHGADMNAIVDGANRRLEERLLQKLVKAGIAQRND